MPDQENLKAWKVKLKMKGHKPKKHKIMGSQIKMKLWEIVLKFKKLKSQSKPN